MSSGTVERSTDRTMLARPIGWLLVGMGLAVALIGAVLGEWEYGVLAAVFVRSGLGCRATHAVTTLTDEWFRLAIPPIFWKRVRYDEVDSFWFVDEAGFLDVVGGVGWRATGRRQRVLIRTTGRASA